MDVLLRLAAGATVCVSFACSPAPAPIRQGTQASAAPDVVTITVDSVWREGDQVAVAYHVALGQPWQGKMIAFLIQPGVPLQSIGSVAPDHWLDRKATYDGRNTIEWAAFDSEDQLGAGQALSGFVMKSRSILGAVPFLVERDEPAALTSEEQLGDSVKITPVWARGSGGTVLGPIAPLPASPADRASQLADDITSWCAADTSVPHGICQSLSNKAAAVQSAAGTPNLDQPVRVFRAELDAQRGKHVIESVYWRLVADLLMVAP